MGKVFVLEKSYPRRGDREQIVLVSPNGHDRPDSVKQLARADKKKESGDARTWIYKESHRFFDNFLRRFKDEGYGVDMVASDGNRVYLEKGVSTDTSITKQIGIF